MNKNQTRRSHTSYNIEFLHDFAQKKGGECLSTEFTKVKDKYNWKCKCGYEWSASFNNIIYGNNWCPKCNGKIKGTITEMQEIARQKNGYCLSPTYRNKNSKLLWLCDSGHIWFATPDSIKNQGSWCRECNNPTYTIEKIKQIARKKGGECLSDIYENYNTVMEWKCELGHIWKSAAKNILKGHWCHECSNSLPKDLEHLIEIAKSRNGKLLSQEYIGMQANYKWECKVGHQWSAPAGAVKAGRWCKKCLMISLEELNKVAINKGGRCISKEYINARTPIEFICKEGHHFEALPTNVLNKNAWCTHCQVSISEEKSRYILEKLLNVHFKKTRKILNYGLELDGYCEISSDLKVAFEYQGEQHYKFNKHFHTNADGFMKQILADLEKRHQCNELDIHLIIIPYYEADNLVDFIKQELKKLNINYNKNIILDLETIYKSKSKIETIGAIAKSKNGKLLSKSYEHYSIRLDFECENGHQFQLRPYELTTLGKWCKHCNRDTERKQYFEKLLNIVFLKSGNCLSSEYIDTNTHLKFECENKHQWETSPAVIFKGHWCPECALLTRKEIKL